MILTELQKNASCAGIVSAGVAGFFIGLALLLNASIDNLSPLFRQGEPVIIPLFVRVTICIWLGGWCFLRHAWRHEYVEQQQACQVARTLIILGVAATFVTVCRYSWRYVF